MATTLTTSRPNRVPIACLLAVTLTMPGQITRAGVLLDENFAGGLNSWSTEGNVVLNNGIPRLTEGSTRPRLWTGQDTIGFLHEVRFRVHLGDLSLEPGSGSIDALLLHVYTGDDVSTVGPDHSDSARLMLEVLGDASVDGLSTVVVVPDLAMGPDWYNAVVEVTISDPAAAIAFSIADRNGIADSSVHIDSVRISEISRGRLANISNRGDVLTGNDILITGFVLQGSDPKALLVRAMAPTLSLFGVTDFLNDSKMDLVPGGGTIAIAENDNWQSGQDPIALTQAFTELGAYPFADESGDSAILMNDLEPLPGGYTVLVSGVDQTTGVALAEIYAVDSGTDGPTELVNISSRGRIGEGDHRPILGWVLTGERGRKVMARAMGPTLNAPASEGGFGLSGFVDDPVVEVHYMNPATSSFELVLANDDWSDGGNSDEVLEVVSAVGAFAPVNDSKDAIVVAALVPGVYTAVARTKNEEHGLALVELYVVTGNRRPVASNDLIYVSAESATIIPVDSFIANYVDPDNDALSIASYEQPSNGSLTRNQDGDFVFTPPSGYIGETLFSYTVTDGEYESLPATVALQVAPANTSVWVGGSEGKFSEPSNWQDGEVPGPEDTVWLANVDEDFTVHLDVDATIKALRVGGAGANVVFTMKSGRTLTVAETVDVQAGSILEFSSGTLVGDGPVRIAGKLLWSGGSMNGSGETIVAAQGSALIDGNVDLRDQRKFTNEGAVIQRGEHSMLVRGSGSTHAVITNAAGGTWTTQDRNGSSIVYAYDGYGQASFINDGTLVVESSSTIGGGGGTTTMTNNATLQIASDQTFTIQTGTHHLAEGSNTTGTGTLKVTAGTLNVSGAANAAVLELTGGILRVEDASLNVGVFTQSDGILNGAQTVTVTDSLHWSGGEQIDAGTLVVADAATALIDGNVSLRSQRKFTNEGNLVQSGKNSMLARGSGSTHPVITNAAGATWTTEQREEAAITYAYDGYGQASFINDGTLTIDSSTSIGGGGGTTILNNSGLIDVDAGSFTCNANSGTSIGDWTVTSGSSFIYNKGTHVLAPGAGFSGEGSLTVTGTANVSVSAEVGVDHLLLSGGTLSVDEGDGLLNVASMAQTGGILGGGGITVVANALTWSGGSMNGSGETIIAAQGSALIDGTVNLRNQRKFTNEGTVTQSGEYSILVRGSGSTHAVITNAAGGTWTTQDRNGSSIVYAYDGYGQASFINDGTLVVESSSTIGGGGGTTVMTNNATLQIASDQTFTIQTGTHHLADDSNTTGTGTLKVTAGALNVSGAANAAVLELTGGTLRVEDAPLSVGVFTQSGGILNGAQTVTVTDSLHWSGGEQIDAGTLVVADAATALIDGNVSLRSQRKFTNEGNLVQSGKNSMLARGSGSTHPVITNAAGATWTTEQREAAAITYAYDGYGHVSFQNIGTLAIDSPTSIGGGGGTTTMTCSGALEINSGLFDFGASNLTLSPSSTLRLTTDGVVAITGSSTLTIAGSLVVTLATGYTPASGAKVNLIGFGSSTGSFSAITPPTGRTFTLTDYGTIQFSVTFN